MNPSPSKSNEIAKEIKLTKGMVAIVDAEDFDRINKSRWQTLKRKGCNRFDYRAMRGVRKNGVKKTIYMHREIMGNPEGMTIDHINGNPLDNRKANLRVCTMSENQKNRRKVGRGYKGFQG